MPAAGTGQTMGERVVIVGAGPGGSGRVGATMIRTRAVLLVSIQWTAYFR